jgi:DNA-directed RNA polymerase specialized sigma24 family protein
MPPHTITDRLIWIQTPASRPVAGTPDELKFSQEVIGSRRMLTDEQIMAAIAGGDQRIYADTVRQHSRAIGYYAFRMLNNLSEAEDVAQETFLRLWTQAERWQPDRAGISTWLHRIAHNLCIDAMRKNRSGITDELEDETEDPSRQ